MRLFGRTCDVLEPNVLFFTIQPDEKIALRFLVKYPYSTNQLYTVRMDFSYKAPSRRRRIDAYERILLDMVKGDLTSLSGKYHRGDVGSSRPDQPKWETQPPPDFPNYRAGTWGPPTAERIMTREGRAWLTT